MFNPTKILQSIRNQHEDHEQEPPSYQQESFADEPQPTVSISIDNTIRVDEEQSYQQN